VYESFAAGFRCEIRTLKNMTDVSIVPNNEKATNALVESLPSLSLASISAPAQQLLMRMFSDPRLLEKSESAELVAQLRECAAMQPKSSELRVLLGMALCVNLNVQEAMEELGEAVSLNPNSYIAHLKIGELWMRLRVCTKAADHTRQASLLAQNLAQSELARRQAATIRTMMREGVERGGYRTPWFSFARLRRLWTRNRREAEALATVEIT